MLLHTEESPLENMVLIILDMLSCDVPTSSYMFTPESQTFEVYKQTNAFGILQVFSISVLAMTQRLL